MSTKNIVEAVNNKNKLLKSFQSKYSLFIDGLEEKITHDRKINNMYKELEDMNKKKEEYDNIVMNEKSLIENNKDDAIRKAEFEGELQAMRKRKELKGKLNEKIKQSNQKQFNLIVIIVLILGLLGYTNREVLLKMFK